MKLRTFLAACAALAAFVSGDALAATDAAAKQAEIQKAAQASLARFYKAKPSLEADVKAAPGYAVFTSYGLSFLVGGSGGTGLAHDAQSGRDTFMNMARATAGPHAAIGKTETLLVFKSRKAFDNFVSKGWEFGAGGAAGAGAGKKTAGGGAGEEFISDAQYYTLTNKGVELGGLFAGTKFWKDKDLN
jgi:lipid-binding SYLF domain-containing protein